MTIPKLEEFFQPQKHTWVVAYRHSAKYIGRLCELNYERIEASSPRFVRQSTSVTLGPIMQLLSPMKQIPLNKQGKPARSQAETVGMAMVPEPIILPADFCSLDIKMYFEGTDIQRFFSDMDKASFDIHKNFIENALENARANDAPGIELATPGDVAAVLRGR
jgi:hypothetical protein